MIFCGTANSLELFPTPFVDVCTWVGGTQVVYSAICQDQLEEQYKLNAGVKSCSDAQLFTEESRIIFDAA